MATTLISKNIQKAIKKFKENKLTESDLRMLLFQAFMEEEEEKEIETPTESLIQECHMLTCNRKEKIETEDWIVRKVVLDRYESEAKSNSNPPKHFRELLYSNEDYKSYFDDLDKSVRGHNAINWKIEMEGDYLCDSLHYADNIYQTLGKNKWRKTGKNDTWYNEPIERCVVITKKGTQCRKSKCEGSDMCTQHFKLA
tara:strand:- start:717 stop:1310 length:594 start_codon:yes stop_codon:yes gene_type:complete